jgi:hypothetical protein
MSVLDFPSSPTNGQYYNGFVWNEANSTWDSAYAPRAATIPISSPNYIINGAFDINQRNFTSTTAFGYGFDRWLYNTGPTGTATFSAQTFPVGAYANPSFPATNYQRAVISGQSAANDVAQLTQLVEDVRTLSNKTITISFWARAASGNPSIAVEVQDRFGTGGSSSVNTFFGKQVISTSWNRYSFTATMPNLSGKTIGANSLSDVRLWLSAGTDFNARTNSLGIQNNTFDIWGVQVEEGAAPTEFRRNAPSIQGELAACQRYFQVLTSWNGFAEGTTSIAAHFPFMQAMRIAPDVVTPLTSNELSMRTISATDYALTGWGVVAATTSPSGLWVLLTGMTGLTDNQAYTMRYIGTGKNGLLSVSAEL